MLNKIKLWLIKHYVISIISLIVIITILIIYLQLHLPYLKNEQLNLSLQFLSAIIGASFSSIIVIYVANIQNNIQKQFLITQENNERERMLLNFYIEKIEDFEIKHKNYINNSNTFIQLVKNMSNEEIKTYFQKIRDEIILIYRFRHIFKNITDENDWEELKTIISSIHNFFSEEAKNIDNNIKNSKLGIIFKEEYYLKSTTIISSIANKLLNFQEDKILNLFLH